LRHRTTSLRRVCHIVASASIDRTAVWPAFSKMAPSSVDRCVTSLAHVVAPRRVTATSLRHIMRHVCNVRSCATSLRHAVRHAPSFMAF
jgi:hypothetical protein